MTPTIELTGWKRCRLNNAVCNVCGGRPADEVVWRYFVSQTTSTMNVCEPCAESIEAPSCHNA